MKTFFCLVSFVVLISICESHLILKQRTIDGQTKTYYKMVGVTNNFQSTIEWCRRLGGHLPIILNQDEFHFFADHVIGKNNDIGGDLSKTWMGLKKDKGSCSFWLDGTPVNLSFDYYSRCESCTAPCCAMYMWNDQDHKKMGFQQCQSEAKAVCVLDDQTMDPVSLTKLAEGVSESFKTLSENTDKQLEMLEKEIKEFESSLSQSQRSLQKHEDDTIALYENHDKDVKKGYQDLLSSTSTTIVVASVVLLMSLILVTSLCFMIYRQNKLY